MTTQRPASPDSETTKISTPSEPQNAATTEHKYPSPRAANGIFMGLMLVIFLSALDRTIIATAIPSITDQFDSLADVGLYGSVYLITSAGFILFFGKIYTFYNPKTVYLALIGIFEIGSLLCAVAPNSKAFIVGRAVAGLGTSGMFAGSITILVHTMPLHKRPARMGLVGMVFGVSSVAGPLLGGAFTDRLSWRWCFYINLPIGAIAAAVIFFLFHLNFKPPKKLTLKEKFLRVDPLGTCLFLPSIVCLLLALQNGGTLWPWKSARVIVLLVLFPILGISFIIVQIWLQETATVPPRIIKNRSIIAGMIYAFFGGASMMTMVYFIPIYFQAIQGSSAVRSGIKTLPFMLGLVSTSLIAGFLTKKIGYFTPWLYFSAIVTPVAAGLITTWSTDTGSPRWIGFQALYGLGVGLGLQQPSMAAQAVLSKTDVPIGASVIMLMQTLGGSIFISVANSIFVNKLSSGLSAAGIPGLTGDAAVQIGATELRHMVDAEFLPVVLKIYNLALRNAFRVALAVSCVMIVGACLMEWTKIQAPGAAAAAAAKKGEAVAGKDVEKGEKVVDEEDKAGSDDGERINETEEKRFGKETV